MAYTPPGRTREKVYRFVAQRLKEGSPPTVREVQKAMGFAAVESARKHLDALVDSGRLEKQPGVARGYRLPGARRQRDLAVLIPLLGEVQAGDLQTAIEAPEGYVMVESRFAADDLFALRVRGDSMVGLAILAGDLVVVRRSVEPSHGDVVVALIGDEATVKILRRRGRRVELHPANPRFRPIVPDPAELRILGVVVELRRALST